MTFTITPLYAALLALMSLALTCSVILGRARTHVSVGDGGDMGLATRIRRHGNFHENVPLTLILMLLAEAGGLLLLVGRPLHEFGLRHDRSVTVGHIAGLTANHIANLICIVALLRAAVM